MAQRTSPSIDRELDRLFQAPLGEFVRVRDALVAELKRQGRAAQAAQLKDIKKPTVSAWAVNQLSFQAADDWAHLEQIGRGLREAYRVLGSGGASEMRRSLQEALRRTVEALQKKAQRFLKQGGAAASAGTLARITTTVHALALRPPDDDVRAGRLSTDVDPPGLEALGAGTGGATAIRGTPRIKERAPRAPVRKRAASRERSKREDRAAARAAEREQAEAIQKERARQAQALKRAQAELRTAEGQHQRSRRAAEAAAQKVAAAQRALDEAEARRAQAEEAEREARERTERARRAVAAAQPGD